MPRAYWDREQATRCFWLLQGDGGPDIRVQLAAAAQQSRSMSSSLIRSVEDVSRKQLELLAKALNDARPK